MGTFGSVVESNTAENDSYETKGEKLIASGIKYMNKPVADILKGSKFTIVIDFYDSLNSVWTKRAMTYDITDAWRHVRRPFDYLRCCSNLIVGDSDNETVHRLDGGFGVGHCLLGGEGRNLPESRSGSVAACRIEGRAVHSRVSEA